MNSGIIEALQEEAPAPVHSGWKSAVGNYLKDKAARFFNSCVAVYLVIITQDGMTAHV